jgi:hypothetical protein
LANELGKTPTDKVWKTVQEMLEKRDSPERRDFLKMLRMVTREDYED